MEQSKARHMGPVSHTGETPLKGFCEGLIGNYVESMRFYVITIKF